MTAIGDRFRELRGEERAALIPYVTSGFPEAGVTAELLPALVEAGADVIELGIPFSDPLADGPTIQRSSQVALDGGTTVSTVLETLKAFRGAHSTPVVLFTYLNPALRYGLDRFCTDALEAGADGLLLTDLPAGADPEAEAVVTGAGLDLIRLVAPTTSAERLPRVVDGAQGFLYYISRTGVTGERAELREGLEAEVGQLRSATDLPIAVGFGISTPDQARLVAGVADGVVVGSAIVRTLEEGGVEGAARFTRTLRVAIDG